MISNNEYKMIYLALESGFIKKKGAYIIYRKNNFFQLNDMLYQSGWWGNVSLVMI